LSVLNFGARCLVRATVTNKLGYFFAIHSVGIGLSFEGQALDAEIAVVSKAGVRFRAGPIVADGGFAGLKGQTFLITCRCWPCAFRAIVNSAMPGLFGFLPGCLLLFSGFFGITPWLRGAAINSGTI
jgi:hypothetical protein